MFGVQMMKNKIVIYTALFGNYDNLIEPHSEFEHCDFVCFTDDDSVISNVWKIILVENKTLYPNMQNRYYKLHPNVFFQDYEFSMYIDSNVMMWNSPFDLISKYMTEFSIAAPAHPHRNCLYQEANEVIRLGKASSEIVNSQMEEYKSLGFPRDFGLCEMNVIIRKHNDIHIINLMNDWWVELNTKSQRDQLSFCFTIWKNKIEIARMTENTREYLGGFFVECHLNDPIMNKLRRKIKKAVVKIYRNVMSV